MAIRIYGLKNCDTCRKARKWLDTEDIEHEFIDLRETVPTLTTLQGWHAAVGDSLLNRRGTTWRQLSDADKTRAEKKMELPKLLREYPALVKRPVVETGNGMLLGFDIAEWKRLLR